MTEILNFITENAGLLIGLGIGGLLVGFKLLARKTKNTLDDQLVDFAEKNQKHVAKFLEEQLKRLAVKKEAPPVEEDKKEETK